MSLYTPAKVAIRNSNVEKEEEMRILVDFKTCLVDKFKKKTSKQLATFEKPWKMIWLGSLEITTFMNFPQAKKIELVRCYCTMFVATS